MDLATTAVFYAVVGAGVAVAQYLSSEAGGPANRGFQAASAWLFWPLYLPLLLRPSSEAECPPHPVTANQFDPAIAQVERELDGAWKSLDGWAEQALSREADRLAELRSAWRLRPSGFTSSISCCRKRRPRFRTVWSPSRMRTIAFIKV